MGKTKRGRRLKTASIRISHSKVVDLGADIIKAAAFMGVHPTVFSRHISGRFLVKPITADRVAAAVKGHFIPLPTNTTTSTLTSPSASHIHVPWAPVTPWQMTLVFEPIRTDI